MTTIIYQIGMFTIVLLLLLFLVAWLIYRDRKDEKKFEEINNDSHQDMPDPNKYKEENY